MTKYKHIALITDFGLDDNFVGVIKGVIYNINPNLNIIDITHNISPQNIIEASFLLENSYKYFPEGTIFLCVVDPGVGTERKVIILKQRKKIFIAPDNGILSFLLHEHKTKEIYYLKLPNKYIPFPQSNTFHGRDIFAPLAGFISKGINIKKLCVPLNNLNKIKKIEFPSIIEKETLIKGKIIYIDRFGNCISNISKEKFFNFVKNKKFCIKIKNLKIKKISKNYQAKEKWGALFNSFNLLEIFATNKNASKRFEIKINQQITVVSLPPG